MTNLLYSEVEEQLRASVRDLLGDRAPVSAVLARTETDEPYDPQLWRALAVDLGVAGLPISGEHGGHGASWREVAIVAEELGRSVAATPFLGSAVLATALATAAGADGLARELASGARTGALVVGLDSTAGSAFPAGVAADGALLTGEVRSAVDATAADLLLVPALDGDRPVVVAIPADHATRTPVTSFDLTRPLCDITFGGSAGDEVASCEPARAALDFALTAGAAVLAAEQVGLAQQCLDMTVAHLKSRYQFGRPIGGFQALKHRSADIWAAVTQARAVARYAVGCLSDGDPDAPVAAALAQAYCSGVAVKAAEECVQLHGGIGFTWEHPAHLYLKRAKADAATLGSAAAHRARLAALVDLPMAAR